MSFGLRTFNEQGIVETDTNTFTYQILFSTTIDFAGASNTATRSFTVPGFNTQTCFAVLLPINLPYPSEFDFVRNIMPWISISGETISVRPVHPNSTDPGAPSYQKSWAAVRLLAVRYR